MVGVVYSGADINLRSSKRSEIITTCKSSQDFHRSYNLRRNQCYFDCIIGMKFSTTFTNMVYQATCDGRIIMLDMRTDKPAITFEGNCFIKLLLKNSNFIIFSLSPILQMTPKMARKDLWLALMLVVMTG